MKKTVDFSNCNGSGNFYRHPLTRYIYTDGIQSVAENIGAFWLIDDVFLSIVESKTLREQKFMTVTLMRTKPDHAVIVYDDGNGNVLYRSKEFFTDFEFSKVINAYGSGPDQFMMFFENGVLMVPNER